MNGELAVLAALAAHGGRWLRQEGDELPPQLLRENSAFQFVGTFTAQAVRNSVLRKAVTTTSPEAWLVAMRSSGVIDLELVTASGHIGPLAPHVAVAFANSGSSALLARGRRGSSVWTIRWEVGNADAQDSRIWALEAKRIDLAVPRWRTDVAGAREGLGEALEGIRTFAERTPELAGWSSWFTKASALLTAEAPEPPWHRDLLPADAALARRQLAAATVQGWVFGGMGSWNDAGFADAAVRAEHERVGANLHSALLTAIETAANGS